MPITSSIHDNRSRMDAALHRDINPDMHVRHFCVFGREASLYYAEGLCSIDFLQHYVLTPLTALRDVPAPEALPTALCQVNIVAYDIITNNKKTEVFRFYTEIFRF